MKIFVNIRLQIVAIIVLLIVQSAKLIAQESKYFASINEVIAFTKNNNITFQKEN